MCVTRKPWPLGNKYHTIYCGVFGTMYAIELVKVRQYFTPERRPKESNKLGNTVNLIL